MRITNGMMVSQFLNDANGSLNRLANAQSVVDSTKRISNIADDPMATISALKARNKLSTLADYQSSIKTSDSYLAEAESSVSSLNTAVQSAYELIVSANSGSKTDTNLATISQELTNLRDEVLSIANSTMGTTYLFGGANTVGTSSGGTGTPPFSVDNATGHLMYNGIDMTALSLKEEYTSSTDKMTSGYTDVMTAIGTLGNSSTTDYYAKNTVCPKIVSSLKDMITNGKNAILSAEQFGNVDTTGLVDVVNNLTTMKENLENEMSKGLGSTENPFSISGCLSKLTTLTDTAAPTFKNKMDAAILAVGTQLDVTADQAKLATEKNASTVLQIGSTQTMEITMNGVQLLGSGASNLYHVLDKCASILSGKLDSTLADTTALTDTKLGKDLLKDLSSVLQDSQSGVLSLQTKIGTSRNRLDMISDRYTSSNLTYTTMKSDAEDADMAEAYTAFTTAKTVYNAALSAGASIIQTSLLDFLN